MRSTSTCLFPFTAAASGIAFIYIATPPIDEIHEECFTFSRKKKELFIQMRLPYDVVKQASVSEALHLMAHHYLETLNENFHSKRLRTLIKLICPRRTAFIRNPRLVGSTRSRLSTNLLFAKNHFRSGSIKQTKMRFYPIINRLLLLLFLLTQISTFGQYAYTLIGEVIDGKEKIPATGATIRLLVDSILTKKMIQYTVSDYDGVFTLTNIPSGSYKLQIVPVGYRDSIFLLL